MAGRKGKKVRGAGKRRNIGATRTECDNDRSAVPTMTPSGEKGDELMFVNDESNGSSVSVRIAQLAEEAQHAHEASFLKRREWFHATLRVISADGQKVIDKSGRSRLPTARGIDRVLLEERSSVVFSVGASHGDEKRMALVTMVYDASDCSAFYSRYDLNESDNAPTLVLGYSCDITYEAFRWIYDYGAGLGWVFSPIFAQEVA